jgi:redox-sensitive bicupin YhaK (pirin superfamily)
MMTIRKSDDRGHAQFGWLDSRHTFSFGSYFDPHHMGFGALRVINQDWVAPGKGFGTHGHRDMEIISYVLEGQLAHRDSTGSAGVIEPGDVQVMSAGKGIRHSEMNGRDDAPVRFLQIWIEPAVGGTAPGYTQKHFEATDGLTLLVSPDGRDGSLPIKQDAALYRLRLAAHQGARLDIDREKAWIQVVDGRLRVGDAVVEAGDGLALTEVDTVDFEALTRAEALIFDLH